VYVSGSEGGWIATVKYDPQGSLVWVARYPGFSRGLAVDASGNVWVIGVSSGDNYFDWIIINYFPNGYLHWWVDYDDPWHHDDMPRALVVDRSGHCYVTGLAGNAGGDYDFLTIKYGPDGRTIWQARYSDPLTSGYGAHGVGLDIFGNVYVTGTGTGGDSEERRGFATLKYDANGRQLWVSRLLGTHYDGSGFFVDAAGNTYITASLGTSTGDPQPVVLRHDPRGSLLWASEFPLKGRWGFIDKLAVDRNHSVYATGIAGADLVTMKSTQPSVDGKPVILLAPQDRVVRAGGWSTLAVFASGRGRLNYQWYIEEAPIPNATNAVLAIRNASAASAGFYSVTVSNQRGAVHSPDARVSVSGL
jgi:hypothetical protein